MRETGALNKNLASTLVLFIVLLAGNQGNAQTLSGFDQPSAVLDELLTQATPSRLLDLGLQERQVDLLLSDYGLIAQSLSDETPTMHAYYCINASDEPKKEEKKEAQAEPEKERNGGIRLGVLIPTSAKVEKLSVMPAAGLFWFTNPIDENKKWRVELGLDAAFRNESGVDDKLFLFRAGIGYVATENVIIVGGLGYALEKYDYSGYHDSYSAALFNIGALYRISKIIDVRLDYCIFAGSQNTTGAVYLTAGIWF